MILMHSVPDAAHRLSSKFKDGASNSLAMVFNIICNTSDKLNLVRILRALRIHLLSIFIILAPRSFAEAPAYSLKNPIWGEIDADSTARACNLIGFDEFVVPGAEPDPEDYLPSYYTKMTLAGWSSFFRAFQASGYSTMSKGMTDYEGHVVQRVADPIVPTHEITIPAAVVESSGPASLDWPSSLADACSRFPVGGNETNIVNVVDIGGTPTSKVHKKNDGICSGGPTGYGYGITEKYDKNTSEATLSEPDTPQNARARARAERGKEAHTYWTLRQSPNKRIWYEQEASFSGKFDTCPGKYDLCYILQTTNLRTNTTTTKLIRKGVELGADGQTETIDLPFAEGMDYSLVPFFYTSYSAVYVALEPKEESGCTPCASSGTPGPSGPPPRLASVHWTLPLQQRGDGDSLGALILSKENMIPALISPQALRLDLGAHFAGEVSNDQDGFRQSVSPDRVVDRQSIQNGYELRVYGRSGVTLTGATMPYAISGTPAVVWRITGMISGGGGELRIERVDGAQVYPYVFTFDPGNQRWTLSEGADRTIQRTTTVDPATGNRLILEEMRNANDTLAAVTLYERASFPWGESDVKVSRDPNGRNLWIKKTYGTSGGNKGRVTRVDQWDGHWEEYLYNGSGDLVETRRFSSISPGYTTVTNEKDFIWEDWDEDDVADLQGSRSVDSSTGLITYEVIYSERRASSMGEYRVTSRTVSSDSELSWDDPLNEATSRHVIRGGPFDGAVIFESFADGKIRTYSATRDEVGGKEEIIRVGWPAADGMTVAAGTETRIVTENYREIGRWEYDIVTGLLIGKTEVSLLDQWGRAIQIERMDGLLEQRSYSPCCGRLTYRNDHQGAHHSTYDALGRLETETHAGITKRYSYDAADRVLSVSRYPVSSPTNVIIVERSEYDLAGDRRARTDALDRRTEYHPSFESQTSRHVLETRLPFDPAWPAAERGVGISRRGIDRLTLSTIGTAVAPVRFVHGRSTLPDASFWGFGASTLFSYISTIKLDTAGGDTAEVETSFADPFGRTVKVTRGDGSENKRFYDPAGRLVRQIDPDGVQTLFARLPATATNGERQVTAIDVNRNGEVDFGGDDRITRVTTAVATRTDGGQTYAVRRFTTERWESKGDGTPTIVSIDEITPDGRRSWRTEYPVSASPLLTQTTTTYDLAAETRTERIRRADGTVVRFYVANRLVRETRHDANESAISETLYGYDSHGRLNVVSALQPPGSALPPAGSPLVTTTTYFADDQIQTVTTPDPDTARSGPGYDPQTTTYAYDAAGRVNTTTHPDATQTYTTYWPTGAVKRTWGSLTYPSEYGYDAQGRLKTLTTWQDFTATSGAAVTTWNYSPVRGWLISKRYTDGTGPDYDYWPSGRLKTRDWARSVSGARLRSSYAYNDAGDLASIDYSDSTPDVGNTYDRVGRLHTTTDAAGLLTRSYQNGRLDDEVYSGSGALAGWSVTRLQDALHRADSLSVPSLYSVSYAYDEAGRLSAVTQGTRVATLDYKPQVGTHESTAITVSGLPRAAVARTIDALGRINRIDTVSGATLHARRDYTYNDANQRTAVEHEDTFRWAYGYDALGQVTTAQKQSAAAALLPGYDHAYLYDTIGNRVSTTTNGRSAVYTRDLRNQYVSRTVPGAFDVLGSAPAGVNVLVGGEAASSSDTLFHRAVPAQNVSAPVSTSVEVMGAVPGAPDKVANETRDAFVAQTPESFIHDLDGNLVQDGRWTYIWDGENRLVEMATRADVATQASSLPRRKLAFVYDSQGRRIRKQTFTWGGGLWVPETETKFIYDGWNLVAELDGFANETLLRTHVWGLDLSVSAQGAGGVGGLLWTTTSAGAFAPGYDANGNIVVWIDLANGNVAGRRDYGPFGEPLLATGLARSLPHAFSTKYRDTEAELYYYGYRFYNPSVGRWLSRDPITELGGLNMYVFVNNGPSNTRDYLGLSVSLNCADLWNDPAFLKLDPVQQGLVVAACNTQVICPGCTPPPPPPPPLPPPQPPSIIPPLPEPPVFATGGRCFSECAVDCLIKAGLEFLVGKARELGINAIRHEIVEAVVRRSNPFYAASDLGDILGCIAQCAIWKDDGSIR